MGAKKFDTSLETREIKLFGRDIPGFCRDIPGAPEKFEKKKFVFNFRSLSMHLVDCFFFFVFSGANTPGVGDFVFGILGFLGSVAGPQDRHRKQKKQQCAY